jgi:hypothetical protein
MYAKVGKSNEQEFMQEYGGFGKFSRGGKYLVGKGTLGDYVLQPPEVTFAAPGGLGDYVLRRPEVTFGELPISAGEAAALGVGSILLMGLGLVLTGAVVIWVVRAIKK